MNLFQYNYIFQLSLPEEGADEGPLPLRPAAALSSPRSQAPLGPHRHRTTAKIPDSSTSKTPLLALSAHAEEGSPNFHVHSAQSLSALIGLAPPLPPACR